MDEPDELDEFLEMVGEDYREPIRMTIIRETVIARAMPTVIATEIGDIAPMKDPYD